MADLRLIHPFADSPTLLIGLFGLRVGVRGVGHTQAHAPSRRTIGYYSDEGKLKGGNGLTTASRDFCDPCCSLLLHPLLHYIGLSLGSPTKHHRGLVFVRPPWHCCCCCCCCCCCRSCCCRCYRCCCCCYCRRRGRRCCDGCFWYDFLHRQYHTVLPANHSCAYSFACAASCQRNGIVCQEQRRKQQRQQQQQQHTLLLSNASCAQPLHRPQRLCRRVVAVRRPLAAACWLSYIAAAAAVPSLSPFRAAV